MRLFVALNLPEAQQAAIHAHARFLRELDLPVRWVAPETIHLTLRFLGEVDEARVGEVKAAISRVAARFSPFSVPIGGFGVFPSVTRPRVFWVGVEATPELTRLQRELEAELAGLGFPPEPQPFHPHLTLGRARREARPSDFRGLPEWSSRWRYRDVLAVESVDLMQSHLSPQGARYQRIVAAGLGVPPEEGTMGTRS
jgi:2'-5' RNA ligase